MVSLTSPASPVSSLRNRLKSTREPPLSPTTPKALVERLPSCIIQEIGQHADTRSLLHLTLCSRRMSKLFSPILYSTVELTTNKHCKVTLLAFLKRPDITQHIRSLIVRPNSLEWTEHGDEIDESLVSTMLSRMSHCLQSLETFEWDGLEMPQDELWSALKISCRHLKRISTSIGEDSLNSSNPLWDFSDLKGFSLNVKCNSLDWLADGLPPTEKLPRKCWEMLLERCPRLEELKIAGPAPSPRVFDIRHVASGRWSRLKSLTLGDMVMISSSKGEEQARKDHAAFTAFFIAHPNLKHIILRHSGGSKHFPSAFSLPASALPNVEHFGGPLKFVKTLPFPQRLRHLTLTSLHHMASAFPPTFGMLQELRWLESLSIWIDLSFGRASNGHLYHYGYGHHHGIGIGENNGHQPYDDLYVLRNLVISRPGLKHLEVACFTRPTFAIRDFSVVLQHAPTLQSFVLTKVHKSSEEDLTKSATRLVSENPNLKWFTLRTTHDSWLTPAGGRVKQLGTYEALEYDVRNTDMNLSTSCQEIGAYGPPEPQQMGACAPPFAGALNMPAVTAILAREWGQRNITGKEYSRHTVHSISPPRQSSSTHTHKPTGSWSSSSTTGTGNGNFPPSSWQTGMGMGSLTSRSSIRSSRSSSMKSRRRPSSSGCPSSSSGPGWSTWLTLGSSNADVTTSGNDNSSGRSTPSSIRRLSWKLTGRGSRASSVDGIHALAATSSSFVKPGLSATFALPTSVGGTIGDLGALTPSQPTENGPSNGSFAISSVPLSSPAAVNVSPRSSFSSGRSTFGGSAGGHQSVHGHQQHGIQQHQVTWAPSVTRRNTTTGHRDGLGRSASGSTSSGSSSNGDSYGHCSNSSTSTRQSSFSGTALTSASKSASDPIPSATSYSSSGISHAHPVVTTVSNPTSNPVGLDAKKGKLAFWKKSLSPHHRKPIETTNMVDGFVMV